MKQHLFIAVAALFTQVVAVAWDIPGHIIVMKIAYDNTSPNARKKLDQLAQTIHLKVGNTDHTFNGVNIAAWADEIKHVGPAATPFAGDFAPWHFIDLGLHYADGGDPDLIKKHAPELSQTDGTVVEALEACVAAISTKAYKQDLVPNEAVAVALVCHLVGDIHQPLHCTSNYARQWKGNPHDGGGNGVPTTNFPNRYPELHQFWDVSYKTTYDSTTNTVTTAADLETFKTTSDSAALVAAVKEVMKQKPSSITLSGSFVDWAKETHDAGVVQAYGLLTSENQDFTNGDVTLSKNYQENAKKVAQRQMCIAGLRLAALLEKLYP